MFGMFKRNSTLRKIERLTQGRKFDEASTLVNSLMEAEPKNATFMLYAAVNEFERGNLDSAKTYIEQALAIDSQNPVFHLAMGEILYSQQQFDASLAALEKSAELSPDNPRTEYLLGLNALSLGYTDRATLHFEKVARDDREFLLARLLLLAEKHFVATKA